MKIHRLFASLLFCSFGILTTSFASSSRGTAGFQFLRTQVSPRPAGMAGAFVSVTGDAAAVWFNPAGVITVPPTSPAHSADSQGSSITTPIAIEPFSRSIQVSVSKHVLDFTSGFASYAFDLKTIGRSQFSVAFMSYGKFDETGPTGLRTGRTFGAGTIVAIQTLARSLTRQLVAGLSLKYVHSYIDTYTSQAVVADLGFAFHGPLEDMVVGAAVQNVGQVFSAFVENKDQLPTCYRVGWSKRLAHLPLLYSVEFFKYVDDDFQFAIGGEFTVTPQLFLRFGYSSLARQMKVDTDTDQFAGVSIGIGFTWRRYRFDYALSSLGQIGTVNRFGLNAAL